MEKKQRDENKKADNRAIHCNVRAGTGVCVCARLPACLCVCEALKGEGWGGAALDYYFIIASYCSWLHSPRGFPHTHSPVVMQLSSDVLR